ncbi:hypothetical protein DFH28DRAFT_1173368 [Melampsora americana]|nr:hypothetical protein DFH28DRAFT_1173368 [Melampsora americana]
MYSLFLILVAQILFILVISVKPPEKPLWESGLGQETSKESFWGINNNLKPVETENDETQIITTAPHSPGVGYLQSVRDYLMDETDIVGLDGVEYPPEAESYLDLFSQELGNSQHGGTSPQGVLGEQIFHSPDDQPQTSTSSFSQIANQGKENHLDLNSIFHSGNGQALEHIHNMGIQSTKYIPGNELNAYETTSISNPLHSADSFNEYF